MPSVFFITHPDVVIKPSVPVRDWPLTECGRERMRSLVAAACVHKVRSIFASSERKADEGAQILADGSGSRDMWSFDELCENDRSATGYLPAQARIICAIERILSQASGNGDLAIVGHGGTGTLLYCSLAGLPIDRRYDQPATNGGNWFAFDRASRRLLHDGWRSIDAAAQGCTPRPAAARERS
jgi:broad specificity phosphatase PhoE